VVVSGISSEQIVKTQDRDAAEVVRRIPGVTIVDNRFIQIRGLSDRYNTVWLNDVTAPSSETDRKSFSFDIVPSSLIDRVLVFKDPSPELPGDFAGGLVKVYLRKPVFTEKLFTVNYSAGWRANTTGREFFTDRPQAGDAFGFGATKRDLPNGMPPLSTAYQQYERDFYAKQLDNNFAIFRQAAAMPDIRFNATLLDQIKLFGKEIGSVSSVNYTNTFTHFGINRNLFDASGARTDQFRDDQSTQNIRLGAIQNFGLVLKNGGRLEWRNLFSQQSRNQVVTREGRDDLGALNRRSYLLGYQGRTTFTSQVAGTHNWADEKTHFDWVGGYGYSARNEPDLRRLGYQVTPGNDQTPETQTVLTPAAGQVDVNNAGRLYQRLSEHIFTLNANLKRTVDVADRKVEIGAGTYLEYRRRSFGARAFGYSFNAGGNRALLNENVGNIFAPGNIGPLGFRVDEDLNSTYRYNAHNELEAAYLSFNIPFTEQLKLVTGARYERNVQYIATGLNGQPVTQNVVTNFVLPSANLSYNFTPTSLVRAAYGRSLNRPEFREAAPFFYYDFDFNVLNYGSLYLQPTQPLKVASIDNFDLRYEWYPTPGELVHVGAFYKHFTNPIENTVVLTTNLAYTFANAPSAYAYGVELDVKKNLAFINERLKNLSFVFNASLIKSQVNLGSGFVAWNSKRALQGQSPYVFNGGLYFNTPDNAWQVTALYNVFGPRILFAGSDQYPDVVELPRHTVDLSITKTVSQRLSLNAGVQDLFNQQVNLVQDFERNQKYSAADPSITNYRRGSYYTLGLRFTLEPRTRPLTPVP
jgi:TonB-dependent receptor